MMTIADLRLSSTAPQRWRRSVCRRRWPSFATLPTDCYWGVNAAMPYCGCILIPLLPVGRSVGRSVRNKGCRALEGSLQKDKVRAKLSNYLTKVGPYSPRKLFFVFFLMFVVCRFWPSKQSFGYVFLDLARCVFVEVFVRDWLKTKICLESFRRPQISQNISCFRRSQKIYQNIAMLLGLSRLGNAAGVV